MKPNKSKKSKLSDHLKFIITTAKKLIEPQKIILFGSRARGDARPQSDFDLAFIFKNKKLWPKFTTVIHEETPSLYKYDCIDFEKIDKDFKNKILAEGITLYESRHP